MEEASVLLANLFSTSGPNVENELALLYTELNKTKSTRLFLQELRRFTEFFKTAGCRMNYHYRWIAVYGLLNECFQREVDDTGAVSEILSCMENFFTCTHTEFLLLTHVAFLGGHLFSSPADEEAARFLKYFLHHANQGRLKLYRSRFVSIFGLCGPIYFSCEAYTEKPRSILTLLQYGGSLAGRNEIFRRYFPKTLYFILRALVHHGEQLNLWDGVTLEFREQSWTTSVAMRNLCTIFQAVLSDTLNPHEATFYLAGSYTWLDAPGYRTPQLGNMIPFYDTLFPGCLYGRRNPSSLRHMCRYSIRKALYDNWKLPDGIQSLPIPQILKDYVNLLEDL